MERTPTRKRENSEQRILDAAISLFATRGYAATGIRQIADKVGLTTASLYYYAQTKDELLLRVMRVGLGELLASGEEAVAASTDPREQIRGLLKVHLNFAAGNPERARVIDNEFQWLDDEDRESVIALRDAYEQLWADAITEGCRRGIFLVKNVSLTRLALLEMCNGATHWYRANGPMSLEQIVTAFEDMAFALLRTDEPLTVAPNPGAGLTVETAQSPQ